MRTFAEYCEYPFYIDVTIDDLYRRQNPGCMYAAAVPGTDTRVARSLAWVHSVARGTTDSLCNTTD